MKVATSQVAPKTPTVLPTNRPRMMPSVIGSLSELKNAPKPPSATPAEKNANTGTATADLDRISERVTSALIGVQDRAPQARVVLVGYPQLIPAEGSCPALLPLAEGDLPFARTVNRGLADALENAAEAAGVEYVDTFALSRGHDICADEPWVNGQVNDPERALAFHPFAAGQEAVADALVRLLSKSPRTAA